MNNIEKLKWSTFKEYFTDMQNGGGYEPYRIYHIEDINEFLEMCVDEEHEATYYAIYTIEELINSWKNDILNDYDLGFISYEDVTKMGIVIPKKGEKI